MWQGQQVVLCHKERQPVGLLVLREKEQVKQFLGRRKVSANDFFFVNPERIGKKEIKTGRSSAAERLTRVRKGRWFESIRPDDGTHHLTHDVSSLEEQWCPRDPVCTPPDTPAIPKLGNGQEVSARYVRENPRSSDAVLAIAANPRSRARFTVPDNVVRRRQNPR